MSKKPETLFKEHVRTRLNKMKRCSIVKIQQMAIRGDPDFILCLNGFSVWIELKKDDKLKADKLQEYKLWKHSEISGGYSFVMHPGNMRAIFFFLHRLSEKRTRKEEIPEWLQLNSPS